ncbi:MAG: hypothetical protein RL594_917 [Bacteroidota bacterium]|jgi:hypothetical protein
MFLRVVPVSVDVVIGGKITGFCVDFAPYDEPDARFVFCGMKIQLSQIAHARSGDKGDAANCGVIAYKEEWYPILRDHLTAEKVQAYFAGMCHGTVERFELPNLWAVNFLLPNILGGGGTVSLKLDAQGKTVASAMLLMELEVPDGAISLS